jgi:8-oxo-dGTP pyrophosphatase MutT (NUDIX family)
VSLLERVRACRVHDLGGMLPFEVDGVRLGWVEPATAITLAASGEAFEIEGGRVTLAAHLDEPSSRTDAVAETLLALRGTGALGGWRGEQFAVVPEWGAPEALRVERAAAPLLGIRAFGVHLNGWVRAADGPRLWVATRSRTKATGPGKLDHLVAGGQPAGLTLRENLEKECREEAGLPAELARRAVAMAPFRYRLSVPRGLRDDTLFVYDLECPADFVPRPQDGEVESFALLPAREVLERLRATDDFKFNVAPCVLGFLLRCGALSPSDPEHGVVLGELGDAVLRPLVPECA